MGDMIERVAVAMAKADGYIGLMSMPRGKRETYVNRSKAAIEAMRTPTDEVYEAGNVICRRILFNSSSVWEAMIDASLSQPK